MSVLTEAAERLAERLQAKVECRNLRDGDVFDRDLKMNVVHSDPDWVWVSVLDNKIKAVIVAAPYHGAVFVGQLVSTEDIVLLPLLRKFVADIEARGFPGFFSFLNQALVKERKLVSILDLAGADIAPDSYSMVWLQVPTERKW